MARHSIIFLALAAGCGGGGGASDPGVPAMFYGPKCTAEVAGVALPMCISAVIGEREGLTHLYLNFCVANGVDGCQAPSPIYVSLLLPTPTWSEGEFQEAAGRVELGLPDGRRYRREGSVPLTLSVRRQPNGPNLHGELVIAVPRVDAAGEPLTLRARVN